jgi:hypothetical protein
MSDNSIPKQYEPLVQRLEDAADGAHDYEGAIGLLQNTEAALRAVLVALVGSPEGPGGVPPAVPGLRADWNTARAAKTAATAAFASAKSNGRALASACVNVLKPRLGNSWTSEWMNAGFPSGSIAIPANPMTLLQQMRAYFEANPTHEKPDVGAGVDVTAAACETAAQAISTASAASNNSNVASGEAKSAYEAGLAAARARLSGLRNELTQLLAPDDDRWYAFGFEKPGNPQRPEDPENLTGVPGTGGMLFVDFDDARRATTYHGKVFNVASNTLITERTAHDSEITFQDLPLNTPLRIEITASNITGTSHPATLLITLT